MVWGLLLGASHLLETATAEQRSTEFIRDKVAADYRERYFRQPATKNTTEASVTTPTAALAKRKFRDVNQNCPALDPPAEEVFFSLSESFLKNEVKLMMDFTNLLNRDDSGEITEKIDDQRKLYERFNAWNDINDQTLVAKTNDTKICFTAFSSVQGTNVFDQWQNINPFRVRIGDTDCVSRRGYYSAYFSTFYKEYRRSIDDCVASCEGGCPLVMGGHSQGGSASVIGSIDLIHYNPEVITFGAPRALIRTDPCTTIDATRHYRFLNTDPRRYDFAPFQINIFNEKHVGNAIFMDSNGNFPLSQPDDDNKSRFGLSTDLHANELYTARISELVDRNCFPVPVSKWPEGHYCSYDDECASRYCEDRHCKVGLRW